MNKGIIIGRLVRNPELRYTSSNKAVTKITIACNNTKDDTTFLDITIFGKMAEATNEYCQKGDLLGIEYIVKNHNWEDNQGNKHYEYTFIANKVTFLSESSSDKKTVEDNRKPVEMTKKVEKDIYEEFNNEVALTDDDLPF